MEVMTIAELHEKANDFSAQHLFTAGYLFAAYTEGIISKEMFIALTELSTPSIEETGLFQAHAEYHPTRKIQNPHKITIFIP